jgi:hypothetical protein
MKDVQTTLKREQNIQMSLQGEESDMWASHKPIEIPQIGSAINAEKDPHVVLYIRSPFRPSPRTGSGSLQPGYRSNPDVKHG